MDGSNFLSSDEALAVSIEQDAEKMRKDLEKCHGEETLYYAKQNKNNLKCLINIEACIIKDKKVFSVGAFQMKFTLKKSEIKDNQVSIKKLKQLCNTLYTPGFHAKTLTLSREADASEIVISWDDLGASKVEAEHLACLVENQCHECMVEAYSLINQGVETKVQVKMVASASSSSLEEELYGSASIDSYEEDTKLKLPTALSDAVKQINASSVNQARQSKQLTKSSDSSAEEGHSSDSDLLDSPESSEGSLYKPSEDSPEEEDSYQFGKK